MQEGEFDLMADDGRADFEVPPHRSMWERAVRWFRVRWYLAKDWWDEFKSQ